MIDKDTSAELLTEQLKSLTLTGCQFVGLSGYENAQGEVSDYTVNVGISYENAVKADIKTLSELVMSEDDITKFKRNHDKLHDEISDEDYLILLEDAHKALLESLKKPSTRKDPYEHIIEGGGLKKHTEKGSLYVYGFKQSKKVLVESKTEKKVVKSRPATLAKNYIRNNYMRTAKYTQFKLDNFQKVKINGEQIIFE